MLACATDDSLLIHSPLPTSFLEYLTSLGIGTPRHSVLPHVIPEHSLTPFGWNQETIDLGQRYEHATAHPPWSSVVTVNSRCFSAELERHLKVPTAVCGLARTLGELEAVLHAEPPHQQEWLVKSYHGNAALANRRVRARELRPAERRLFSQWLGEDNGVVVERWHHRVLDLCTTLEVTPSGASHRCHSHEVVNSADGAFIGALYEPAPIWRNQYQSCLDDMGKEVGARLAATGYLGPACFDSYAYLDGANPALRPLVEINARRHMSLGAECLWRTWGASLVCYWRLYNRAKLTLPESYDRLQDILAADAFSPRTRRGALLTSPMSGNSTDAARRPLRLGVMFAGDTHDEVLAMDQRFRSTFEH